MKEFELTPAIKWLEDNWQENSKYDDADGCRGIFSIKEDHGCVSYIPDYCSWAHQDEQEMMWVGVGITEEWWMDQDLTFQTEDYDYTLSVAAKSPFFRSIAQ